MKSIRNNTKGENNVNFKFGLFLSFLFKKQGMAVVLVQVTSVSDFDPKLPHFLLTLSRFRNQAEFKFFKVFFCLKDILNVYFPFLT